MIDKSQSLMTQIAQIVSELVPAGWVLASVTTRIVTGAAEQSSRYYARVGGEELSFFSGSETMKYFKQLREAMYETAPAQGAWYVAVLNLTPDGKFAYKFDYDDTTQFEVTPDPEDFEYDLKRFPRAT